MHSLTLRVERSGNLEDDPEDRKCEQALRDAAACAEANPHRDPQDALPQWTAVVPGRELRTVTCPHPKGEREILPGFVRGRLDYGLTARNTWRRRTGVSRKPNF